MLDALRRAGARAVEQEGAGVRAWVPLPDGRLPADGTAVRRAVAKVESAVRASTSDPDMHVAWEVQPHEAWAARWAHGAAPIRVADDMVVVPSDVDVTRVARAGDVVIRLEAGVAFGNAEHPTTRGCLQLLRREMAPGAVVCDVGTGTGVLAVAAALLGAGRVLALEADPLAADAARRNARTNGVADRLTVRTHAVTPADAGALPPADLILANLEAPLLTGLLPGLRGALRTGGALIVSGVTGGERVAFEGAAADAGLRVHRECTADGWWSAVLRCNGQPPRA